jgi:hypothetical protein
VGRHGAAADCAERQSNDLNGTLFEMKADDERAKPSAFLAKAFPPATAVRAFSRPI